MPVMAVMGESGGGKTSSLRNLDPATTYYFDCDGKGMAHRAWKKAFNSEAKNYVKTDNADTVLSYLNNINDKAPHIKTVIIDTVNAIMVARESVDRKAKGYDKWSDLAWSIWDLVNYALTVRDDLTIVFLAHSVTTIDDYNNRFTRILTNGRKLEKLCIETKMPVVLWARQNKAGEYVFQVHNTVTNPSTCKTPMGMFDVDEIPNDLHAVLDAWHEYENGE